MRLKLIGALCFVAAYRMPPLYYSNQNTKFLHGLASAYPDRLAADWTAHTVDGLPVFSGFVYLVAKLGHPLIFQAVEAVLLGTLFVSLLTIGLNATPRRADSGSDRLGLAALLVIMASSEPLRAYLKGVAEQYLVNGYLQPSEFGVLYIAALALAMTGRNRLALLLAAIPAALHPTYILMSVILVLIIGSFQWRTIRLASLWPVLAVVLLLIIAPPIDLAVRFAPTNPSLFEQANYILADERIPQHSLPSHWFNFGVVVKLALALAAMRMTSSGLLRTTLGVLLVYAAAGAIVVTLTGNPEVALLAPWRVSVLIVPLSAVIVLGQVVHFLGSRLHTPMMRVAALVPLIALAGNASIHGLHDKYTGGLVDRPSEEALFARQNHQPNDIYLTDPADTRFRLAAQTAQFVSWKTHPYKDREVIEWRHRMALARAVFNEPADGGIPNGINCEAIRDLLKQYAVTHLLLKDASVEVPPCSFLQPVMRGVKARIFKIDGPDR